MPISAQPIDLIHVRKTVTFDGGAGKGQSGSPVPLFDLTGKVLIERGTAFLTSGVSAGGGTLAIGLTADTTAIMRAIPVDGASGFPYYVQASSGSGWRENWTDLIASLGGGSTFDNSNFTQTIVVSQSIVGTVGTADITGGTLVIDLWYRPITDDGQLEAA